MDVKSELNRWKNDFAGVKTEREKSEYKKRFKAFVSSLSPSDRKDFIAEYKKGAEQAIEEAYRALRPASSHKRNSNT